MYVLAPVGSPLVNAQNFYTAITRARYGVKLWTENPEKLVEKLELRSGEKTSGLEGLGRLERDHRDRLAARHMRHLQQLKEGQEQERRLRADRQLERQLRAQAFREKGMGDHLADRARKAFEALDRHLQSFLKGRESERADTVHAVEQRAGDRGQEGGRGLAR